MSIFRAVLSRFGFKAARQAGTRLPLPRYGSGYGNFSGVRFNGTGMEWVDYLTVGGRALPIQPKDAGDPLLNPIVSICLGWIGTSWPLAIPQVGRMKGAEFVPDPRPHPFLQVLRRPNPGYGGKWLFWALNCDYWTGGNAYAQILPGRGGIQELNYLPARYVCPKPDASGYLDHYEYEVDGRRFEVPPEEIIHFRYGINPDRPLEGIAPLTSAFREIVKDNSASDYLAGLFNNGGVPPAILTPRVMKDGLGQATISGDEAKAATEALNERLRQEPGRMRVMTNALELHPLAFEPGKMGVEVVLEEPETRIPALFQIPPVVLGLRAGLQQSTYNNVQTAIAQAWNACLIPLQDYFAEELTNKALRLYYPDAAEKVVWYDRSQVGELKPDQDAEREQARADFEAGIITLEEARAVGGRETNDRIRQQLAEDHPAPVLPVPADPNADPNPPPDPQPGPKPKKEAGGGPRDPFRRNGHRTGRLKGHLKGHLKRSGTPTLHGALNSFRSALQEHEDDAVREMTAAYGTVETAVREKLEALTLRMEQAQAAGEPLRASWLYQEERYRALLQQIDESYQGLAGQGAETVTGTQRAAVDTAATHAETLTAAAAGPAPEGASLTWNRLPTATLENLVGFASDGSPLKELLDELGPAASQGVKDALLEGVGLGQSPREIARQVEAVLGGGRARALTIARTETLRAAREASRQSYAANADVVTGWTWVAQLDTETCAGCWAMHGTVHALGETLDDHPNGRCVMAPRTKSWAEITGDPSLSDTRPEIETGADAFAGLSEEQQREILGPGMYELYRSGQIDVPDFVHQEQDDRWGTMRRAATQAEALAAAGAG
ncbi:MAG TPA: phage portal protein [Armatimonadota bacterium]|nr:phage portal protein [Armatimonadota bacterium]